MSYEEFILYQQALDIYREGIKQSHQPQKVQIFIDENTLIGLSCVTVLVITVSAFLHCLLSSRPVQYQQYRSQIEIVKENV